MPAVAAAAGWVVLARCCWALRPARPWWLGLMVALAGLLDRCSLIRHAVRRLGGITGDVLGAAVELTLVVMLLVALT